MLNNKDFAGGVDRLKKLRFKLKITSINLRNNWHHADHNFNQPAEQLASCGPQLQSTCGTIGIMRTTTSINLRNNWHHVDHKFYFNFNVDSLAPIESSTLIFMRTAWQQSKVLLQFWLGQFGTKWKVYFNFHNLTHQNNLS